MWEEHTRPKEQGMFGELEAVITILGPGIAGALLGLTLATHKFPAELGMGALLAGIFGLVANLLVALYVVLWDSLGAQVFTPQALSIAKWSPFVGGIAFFVLGAQSAFKETRLSFLHQSLYLKCTELVLIGLALTLIVLVLYQTILLPVSSWDGLGLWTAEAHKFLRFDVQQVATLVVNDQGVVFSVTRDMGVPYPGDHPRHPLTVVFLSAFTGAGTMEANSVRGWLAAWSSIWLCLAAMVWGFVSWVSGNRVLGALAVCVLCSVPLLENHSTLVGYADFWITVSVVASVSVNTAALLLLNYRILLFGLALGLLPLAMKNIGVLYVIATWCPLLAMFAFQRFGYRFAAFLLMLLLGASLALPSGFDFELLGQRVALVNDEGLTVIFGGYAFPFTLFPFFDVLQNLRHALFINQSFSVIFLFGILGIINLVAKKDTLCKAEDFAVTYLLLVAASIVMAFMAPQFVAEYALTYAVPSSDVGNSRFIMVIAPILILTIGFWGKQGLKN